MAFLVTHAGRHGDCLWALPTVRAISETVGEPVDFCISHKYQGLVPLIQLQPYIRTAFADLTWQVVETAPIGPPEPPLEHRDQQGREYEKIIHLSFRGWPEAPTLAEGYWLNGAEAVPLEDLESGDLLDRKHLFRPWIEAPRGVPPLDMAIGFTDEYFEVKCGIAQLVFWEFSRMGHDIAGQVLTAPGSRWEREAEVLSCSFVSAAAAIQAARVFLGCLSSLAVLAAAIGTPRVLVEPNEQRHHAVFQHWDQPLVLGGDAKPTFDARHVADALKRRLGS